MSGPGRHAQGASRHRAAAPGTEVRAAFRAGRVAIAERERGASAVEYGLLAAAVTGAFLVGTAGFNGALAAIFRTALGAIPGTPVSGP